MPGELLHVAETFSRFRDLAGRAGQVRMQPFPTSTEAEAAAARLSRRKARRGYR